MGRLPPEEQPAGHRPPRGAQGDRRRLLAAPGDVDVVARRVRGLPQPPRRALPASVLEGRRVRDLRPSGAEQIRGGLAATVSVTRRALPEPVRARPGPARLGHGPRPRRGAARVRRCSRRRSRATASPTRRAAWISSPSRVSTGEPCGGGARCCGRGRDLPSGDRTAPSPRCGGSPPWACRRSRAFRS